MVDYSRTLRRFNYTGLQLVPQDELGEGKVAYIRNMRSYQPGTLTVRYGNNRITPPTPLAGAINSIFRLNDTTPFATSGAAERRLIGAGTTLYGGSPGSFTYGVVQTGFSGNPLAGVVAAPINSPRPFLYIGDSARLRKVNSDLSDMSIGIPTPNTPPSAQFAAIQTTNANPMNAGFWTQYGASANPTNIVIRIGAALTTATYIIYDQGTTGMATIALSDMTGIVPGSTVDLDTLPATVEKVIVQEVHPSIGTTTIAAIQYDSGTSGLCSIQPTGSLYTGQIEAELPDTVRRRYEDLNLPVPQRVTVARTIDFPVNSLILLGGVEAVRILSVALGSDGVLSFRCSTSGTYTAGAAVAGISAFRGSIPSAKVAGITAIGWARQNVITPPTTDPATGGIQCPSDGGNLNWGFVGTRATSQNDIIRVGFRAAQFGYITSVRLMLNLSDDTGMGGATFLSNYFLYEWRASDLLSAVQIAAGAATGLVADSQAAAVLQGQVDSAYGHQYGSEASTNREGAAPAPGTGRVDTGRFASPRDPGNVRTDSFVAVGSGASRQLSLGDNQWVWLQCRVGDLTRIGTDVTKTLATINAQCIAVQVAGTTDPITLEFGDLYLTGGYGPDAQQTLPPYVYRYRYRSTITGERSNPSPPMRGGIAPQRGRVTLTGVQSGAQQCDVVDWFRYGGALARWTYVGTSPNASTPTFTDDMEDGQIDGGEALDNNQYQPWPTYDLPRSGTCAVAGTSIQWVSGDTFNTTWGANSVILVNGRATTLYQPPISTTRAQLVDNCGSGTVEFTIPGADFLGQPLPYLWGGPINDVWFNFACGDAADPSLLHWSHGNDPDATSPRNTLVVSSGSEPLQNGFFDDGIPYVFSTERLYRINATFGGQSPFSVTQTQCTRGLWTPWAFAVLPNGGGVVFLAADGFYLSRGGSEAQSITNPDLAILFPQDGSSAQAIRGLYPVNMALTTRLRVAVVDGLVYFDYVDTNGGAQTLVFEPDWQRWSYDTNALTGITCRLGEPGPQVHTEILGGANGHLYQVNAAQMTDGGTTTIAWAVWTPWDMGDDPRAQKQYGDAVLDMNPGTSYDGITVTPVIANGNTALASSVLGQLGAVRATYIAEVNAGVGALSPNFGLQITGGLQLCDIQRPLLYYWEPAWLFKQTIIARRATDWENLGYQGAKFIQGVVLRANTYNNNKQVQVQYDGGTVALTLSVQHNGERQLAYPLAAAGWTPFIAELVRLQGSDALDWALLDWRWVWEPAPELATEWHTQDTTFDLPGYLSVFDAVIAYQATAAVTLDVWHDQTFVSYTLPSTAGLYVRQHTIFQTAKGKSARFRLTSTQPFRLYVKDCSIRVQGWGIPGGYLQTRPFGGPSREVGAAI